MEYRPGVSVNELYFAAGHGLADEAGTQGFLADYSLQRLHLSKTNLMENAQTATSFVLPLLC